jgi:periplasmic mercuric ion binding protein
MRIEPAIRAPSSPVSGPCAFCHERLARVDAHPFFLLSEVHRRAHEIALAELDPAMTQDVIGLCLFPSSTAFAGEKIVTLAVQNMYCADCPFIVKKSLEGVPGVANVTVSFKDKTAVVTYDDSQTDVKGLTAATTNAGYPSAPKG